ncbi:unnamed protein product [Clonostachys rhizophaga]|uniref:NACHT domain-containing protein n=1 Tax=Clonostachys rhizophaga TaxID=160324 RepID=A0A9N9VUC9_9HYPO|nr:unnamed protein product [Clonostachys rhizophaga]
MLPNTAAKVLGTTTGEQSAIVNRVKLGLNQVYPGSSDNLSETKIDIVAVHGLETHSPRTWVAFQTDGNNSSGEVHWLRDENMLPYVIPEARIFTYDWNANVNSDAADQGLFGHANSLLEELHMLRSALHLASARESDYTYLLSATRGIIFLGTPFQGGQNELFTPAEQRVAVAVAMYGERATELVSYLRNDERSRDLDELVHQFCNMIRTYSRDIDIVCYYETMPTKLDKICKGLPDEVSKKLMTKDKTILVDQHSACLPGQTALALDARHAMLNKYRGPDDGTFRRVSFRLRQIATKALKTGPDAWIRNNYYTAERLRIERLSGDCLPMDHCYINLAIVEHRSAEGSKDSGSLGQADRPSPFSCHARLKIDTPHEDIRVELPTIFDPRKGPDDCIKRPRRILIRGRAGVGKTTLCKKMVHDFVHHCMWESLFDRILWVPLRTLKRKPDEGYNLESLFLRDFFGQAEKRKKLAKELHQELHATKFAKALFVLDGLDEVFEGLDPDHKMHGFLIFLLQRPNIVITSRPSARLPDYLSVDLELETIGFSPQQVNEYITNVKGADRQEASEIQSFLAQHSFIQSLVRIPIQLDALCHTWNTDSKAGLISNTMTSVYRAIAEDLWKKDVKRLEKKYRGKVVGVPYIRISGWRAIESLVKFEIRVVEGLAFNGLHNDLIDFEPRDWEAVFHHFEPSETASEFWPEKELPHLSFLRTSDDTSGNRNYHFLHRTYQEYFAASYFVQQWMSNGSLECLSLGSESRRQTRFTPISYLLTHKYDARLDIFWRFVAGLLHSKCDEEEPYRFLSIIEDQPRDLFGPAHQRLVMHCLSEIPQPHKIPQLKQLREHLEVLLKKWLLFQCNVVGFSDLAAETEFPDHVFEAAMQESDSRTTIKLLYSLADRPILSQELVNSVFAYCAKDTRLDVKLAAIKALKRQSPLPDKILARLSILLGHPNTDVVNMAVLTLGMQPGLSGKILSRILALLKDPDEGIRRGASFSIAELELVLPDETVTEVLSLFEDENPRIRSSAAIALGQRTLLPDKILRGIAALLKDSEGDVRAASIACLCRQSPISGQMILDMAALLKDPEPHVRLVAVEALGRQSVLPNEVLVSLKGLFKNPDSNVREAAALAFYQQSVFPREILPDLVPLLQDPESHVASTAASTFAGITELPREILLDIVKLIKNPKEPEDVKFEALRALGGQSQLPTEILPDLVVLVKDRDLILREEVLSKAAILLQDRYATIRERTVLTLSRLSTLPSNILLKVEALLKDPQPYVRFAAATMLDQQSVPLEDILINMIAKRKARVRPGDPVGDAYYSTEEKQIFSRDISPYLEKISDKVFHSLLCKIDGMSFNILYDELLQRSFSDHLTWCVEGTKSRLVLTERTRIIEFKNLQGLVKEAQIFYKVPPS